MPSSKRAFIKPGAKFHKLTLIEVVGRSKYGQPLWLCECSCGGSVVARQGDLGPDKRHKRGCGCEKGGPVKVNTDLKTKARNAWYAAKQRCFNEATPNFHNYGGRGISMHPDWVDDFDCFYKDVGDPPSKSHTLDRIDNDGDYTPTNCRWATRKEQALNRRTNRIIEYNGGSKTLCEWAEEIKVSPTCIVRRLDIMNLSVEDALTGDFSKKTTFHPEKIELYKVAHAASAGDSVKCPWCYNSFIKRTWNQRFCKKGCAVKYNGNVPKRWMVGKDRNDRS